MITRSLTAITALTIVAFTVIFAARALNGGLL